MDNELLKSKVSDPKTAAATPAADLAVEPPVLFLDLDSDEINEIGIIHDFIMPIIEDAKLKLNEKSTPLEIAAWVDVKLTTPGLVLPKRLAGLNSEILRQGLIEEIQIQLTNGSLINSIKEQILSALNEIIDSNPYGETAELIVLLDGFISSIDVLILQNENKITDAQKYEIWFYKDDLSKLNKLIDIQGIDGYDTLIALSRFRKKLGAK